MPIRANFSTGKLCSSCRSHSRQTWPIADPASLHEQHLELSGQKHAQVWGKYYCHCQMDDILLAIHYSGPAGICFDFAAQKILLEFTPQEQERIKGEGSKQAQPRCVKNGGQIHVNFFASSFLSVFYYLLDNLLKLQKLIPGKNSILAPPTTPV